MKKTFFIQNINELFKFDELEKTDEKLYKRHRAIHGMTRWSEDDIEYTLTQLHTEETKYLQKTPKLAVAHKYLY